MKRAKAPAFFSRRRSPNTSSNRAPGFILTLEIARHSYQMAYTKLEGDVNITTSSPEHRFIKSPEIHEGLHLFHYFTEKAHIPLKGD